MKILLSLLLVCQLVVAQTIPAKSNNYINDYADVLNTNEINSLTAICKSIEDQTTAQVVIFITNNLNEDVNSIEEYANNLFKTWGVGNKNKDNGLLILITPNLRKSRIEVGYGLEEYITDIYTKQLQRDHFRPNFKAGNYYAGISEVLTEIQDRIPKPQDTNPVIADNSKSKDISINNASQKEEGTSNFGIKFLIILFFIGILIGILLSYLKEKKKKEDEIKNEEKRKAVYLKLQQLKKEEEVKISENAKNKINKDFQNYSNALKNMNDFSNAKEILNNLKLIHNNALLKIQNSTLKDHSAIGDQVCMDMKLLVNDIVDKFSTTNKILKDFNNFKSEKTILANKFEYTKHWKTVLDKYPLSIWGNTSPIYPMTFDQFWKFVTTYYIDTIGEIDNNNFDNVSNNLKSIEIAISVFDNYYEALNKKMNDITNAELSLNNSKDTFRTAISNVDHSISNISVTPELKSEWNKAKNKFSSEFTALSHQIKRNSIDPLIEIEKFNLFLNSIRPYDDKAQFQIDEENNRQQKILKDKHEEKERIARAKHKEEDRQRRKREEDEDDERRRNSYSSYSSSSYDSSNSSSSSSNDTSFGGGDSGGGGSSDSW